MAMCGLQMFSRDRQIGNAKAGGCLRRLARALVLGLGCAVLAGCATSINFGSMPKVDRLQSLTVGASKAGEVVAALGEPRGRGQSKFDTSFPQTQMWFYEYMQIDGRKAQMKMLLVLMYEDVYVGHIWFSSGQLMGATK